MKLVALANRVLGVGWLARGGAWDLGCMGQGQIVQCVRGCDVISRAAGFHWHTTRGTQNPNLGFWWRQPTSYIIIL